jgi:predicted nucleic acid-binding protein
MKVAVTDACIFIDLIELDLVSSFFKLNIELHTTVDVVNELFPEQKQVLKAYESGDLLTIHNLVEDDFTKMTKISFPRGLSQEDKTVIYLAMGLENSIVLSSDKLVRGFATKQSLKCHGLIWIFDQLVGSTIISKKMAVTMLKNLLSLNQMYQGSMVKKEIEERMVLWGKS